MIQTLTGVQNTAKACAVCRANPAGRHFGKHRQRQHDPWRGWQAVSAAGGGVPESALQQAMSSDGNVQMPAVHVAKIEKDTTPPIKVYDPGNPQAGFQRHDFRTEHRY